MALTRNIRSLLHKVLFYESKPRFRLYSEAVDGEDIENKKEIDPEKDRTKIIPLETSIRYLNSKAYNQTYAEKPVWFFYRRNHKGGFAPKKTRRTCVRNGMISTGNPCPICRDEYLVLDHRNTKLLEQFISEHTGQVLDAFKTGLCRTKQKDLIVAIERAYDQGTITYEVPFREYDYKLYNKTV